MPLATLTRWALPVLLSVAIAACAAPAATPMPLSPTTTPTPTANAPTPTSTAAPATPAPTPTIIAAPNTPAVTPTAEPTHTATPRPSVGNGAPPACHWQWAYADNPELSQQIQEQVAAAGLEGVTVSAYGYGENRVCDDGSVVFHPMETDFRIGVVAPGPVDGETLGNLAAQLLDILAAHPPEATPGPMDSRLDFAVDAMGGDPPAAFSVRWREAQELRRQGLTGAALLEALGYPF